jgi:hypothetical protein
MGVAPAAAIPSVEAVARQILKECAEHYSASQQELERRLSESQAHIQHLGHITMLLSHSIQDLEQKLIVSEHKRLKLEAVVRHTHGLDSNAKFEQACQRSKAKVQDIEQRIRGNNAGRVLLKVDHAQAGKLGIQRLVEPNTNAIQSRLFPNSDQYVFNKQAYEGQK